MHRGDSSLVHVRRRVLAAEPSFSISASSSASSCKSKSFWIWESRSKSSRNELGKWYPAISELSSDAIKAIGGNGRSLCFATGGKARGWLANAMDGAPSKPPAIGSGIRKSRSEKSRNDDVQG